MWISCKWLPFSHVLMEKNKEGVPVAGSMVEILNREFMEGFAENTSVM